MEENKENVVEETTQETTEQVEEIKKPNINEDGDYVVDLNKPENNEQPEENTESNTDDSGVATEPENAEPVQKQEEVQPEAEAQETSVLEEIKEEDVVEEITEEVEEAIAKSESTGKPLPENIQKLVDFIDETGGDINDYVRLNQDYSKLDNQDLLYEYYKQTKPHLNAEEINFLMDDTFSYDEEIDEEKDIKRKKLALKEQVASAKAYLEGQKSRYYEEIKAGSKLTPEQQKAVDFF